MEARPTTNMKKGWLCRTSYDEKNWEIAPVDRDGKNSDEMMIQWWSNFDDDPVMIHLWWWSSDDPALIMIQLSWWTSFDDDLEKKTCVDELCQDNTFIVKRECWCICNFEMYSLEYLILYPNVPIGRIIYISLYPDVPIRRVINIIKSCKVIEVNPSL